MIQRAQGDPRLHLDRLPSAASIEGLDGRLRYVNPALARMLRQSEPSELVGAPAEILFEDPVEARRHRASTLAAGSATAELRYRRADGATMWVMAQSVVTGHPLTGDLEILRIAIDVAEHKASVRSLERDAYHDPLTGLPNRRLLRIRGEQTLTFARRRRERAALLYVDLVGFKAVNDRLGHRNGDALLQETGRRIESVLRSADVAARQGGDEFVVLLGEVDGAAGARLAAARLGERLADPYVLEGRPVALEARFGVALFPDHARDLDGLLRAADEALAEAVREGGPVVRVFGSRASASTRPPHRDLLAPTQGD